MDRNEKEKRALTVSESFGGILPYFEAFYLSSIIYSASRSLEAFARYEYLKEKQIEKLDAEQTIGIVQEAIGHAAALSRYFWPSKGGKTGTNQLKLRECRGIKLCKAFGLDKSSPLYHRTLRNVWEHFDEYLDAYLLENDSGIFFPECKIGSHLLADEQIGHIFKLLDLQEECLVLMGVKFFFSPIKNEVKNVFEKANIAYQKNGRLR
jgi:hypothetical protein